MIVKLLTEHHLEFLSLKGGCTGSCESALVKMSHCWKSHISILCTLNSFNMLKKKNAIYTLPTVPFQNSECRQTHSDILD